MASTGWRIVLSRGSVCCADGASSNPMTATSSGTLPAKLAQCVQCSRGHEVGSSEHGVDTRPMID